VSRREGSRKQEAEHGAFVDDAVVVLSSYCVGLYLLGPYWAAGTGLSGLVVFVFVLLVAGRV
jgi:hypothetical protein